jgi:hypothetical protein
MSLFLDTNLAVNPDRIVFIDFETNIIKFDDHEFQLTRQWSEDSILNLFKTLNDCHFNPYLSKVEQVPDTKFIIIIHRYSLLESTIYNRKHINYIHQDYQSVHISIHNWGVDEFYDHHINLINVIPQKKETDYIQIRLPASEDYDDSEMQLILNSNDKYILTQRREGPWYIWEAPLALAWMPFLEYKHQILYQQKTHDIIIPPDKFNSDIIEVESKPFRLTYY